MDRAAAIRIIESSPFAKHADHLVAGLEESVRIHARRTDMTRLPLGASRFGGNPDLPTGFEWPRWMGWHLGYDSRVRKFCRTPPRETLLEFMAQLRVDELPIFARQVLPKTGWLCFFYDYDNQVGGAAEQRGGWRVVHFDAEASQLIRTQQPDANPLIGSDVCELMFSTEWTLPFWDPLSAYENHEQALVELLKQINGDSWVPTRRTSPRPPIVHRLFGQPDLLHDDMKVDCELAATGFSCDYREPDALSLRASAKERAKDWRLLLQLDTDDASGWVFGDNGRIYYYVRDADLRRQDFNGCWLGLQCY